MWTPFSREHPKEKQFVTIIWGNGGETDCVWTEDGMIWDGEDYITPIFWKSCDTK